MAGLGAMGMATPTMGLDAGLKVDRPILVFDIIETILDTASLGSMIFRIFNDTSALRSWLDNLFIYSEALTIIGAYRDSGAVGMAVLSMMANVRGIDIAPADLEAFKRALVTMPAYPDVHQALMELRRLGYRLVTLSNSPNIVSEAQLRQAGIRQPFDRLFSIDEAVHRYKPARETYLAVAEVLGVSPANLCLISCHGFDVLGAKSAGLRAIFVSRAGNAPFVLGPQPDAVVSSLTMLPAVLAG